MGKKYTNHYTGSEESYTRRKERLSEKNKHSKKNGANYHPGEALAHAAAEKVNQQERVKLPNWLNVCLFLLFGALVVVLILRLTVMKDNMTISYLSSLLLGLACGAVFYVRRFFHKKKKGVGYNILSVILSLVCVVYVGMGLLGLFGLLG